VKPPRVVSISSVYPNRREPGLGLFVRSRLQHMARLTPLTVVAPRPLIDYSNPGSSWLAPGTHGETALDDGVEVLRPIWAFPPGGTPINVLCLFARLLFTLKRLRRRFRIDVIDAHFGYPEGVAAVLLGRVLNCPVAITLRGSERMFAASRYRRACMAWAFRRANAVIAVSEELRAFAVSLGADPVLTHVVPNGIDRDVFHPRDRAACRAAFGMPPGQIAIVSAGELIEAKGHHLVIEAAARLKSEGKSVSVYIAGGVARGGAPFHHEIETRIRAAGLEASVHMAGWLNREDLARLLSAADVFCLASYTEGWPNVVHEALACGTPVVAASVGGVPQMLPEERFGLTFPARDQAALTQALRRAITTVWDRDAIAALGGARSWDDVGREVFDVLCQIGEAVAPASLATATRY
jgi:teichuronic acid biosynthesis glycosyltransferase TuaC